MIAITKELEYYNTEKEINIECMYACMHAWKTATVAVQGNFFALIAFDLDPRYVKII